MPSASGPVSCVLFDLDNTLVDTGNSPLRQTVGEEDGARRRRTRRAPGALLHPDLPCVLADLARGGIRLGLVTNAPRPYVAATLGAAGLRSFFATCLVTGEAPGPSKPAPAPLRRALALLGSPAGDALYVGDSPEDVTASRAAGVAFALAAWARPPRVPDGEADLLLAHPADLLALCGREPTLTNEGSGERGRPYVDL